MMTKRYSKIKAKYGSDVNIEVPPNLGVALISIQTDKFTVGEIMQEFSISPLDEFFDNSLAHREKQLNIKELR